MPAIRLAAAHDYEGFARLELADRNRCKLPPHTRMGRIIVRDADLDRATALADRTARGLRGLAGPSIRVRGPAPCPIARVAGRHRRQIEVLADTAADLQALLSAARSAGILRPGAAVAVDVDPIAML